MSISNNADTQTGLIPTDRIRTLAIGGIIAGIFWLLLGFISLLTQVTGPVLDGTLIVGNVLLMLPIVGLYLLYRDRFPRVGRLSLGVVLIATASNIIGTMAFLGNVESLVFLAFPVGVLGELVGFLGFAWMTARSSRLPRWAGSLLLLTFPGAAAIGRASGTVSEFGDYPGAIAVGAIVTIIGYLMYVYTRSATDE